MIRERIVGSEILCEETNMTKLFTTLSVLLLASSVAIANPVTETNSLSKAALEMVAQDDQAQKNGEKAMLNTHESQKGNSLSHAVLAIQKVGYNLRINSESEVDYTQYSYESEKNNSLGRGALARK